MRKLIVALAAVAVVAAAAECGGVVNDDVHRRAYEFDLSMLHMDPSQGDKLWYRTKDNVIYYVNFCGETKSCNDSDSSVCMRIPNGGGYQYVSGGKTSTQTISLAEDPKENPKHSVTVTYSNGDKCGYGYYKTKIYVNCKEDARPGYFYDINITSDCEATLYMWSAAGCGKEVPYTPSSSSSAPVSSSSAPSTCGAVVTDPKTHDKYEFDLSIIHQNDTTQGDKFWYRTRRNTIYYVNFCGATKSCNDSDVSVCIRIPDGEEYKYVSGGSLSTQEFSIAEDPRQSPDSSVTVTYSNGEKCGDGYRKTKIYVNCKKSAYPGFFYDINERNECEPTLYMWSAAGCGKKL